MKIFCNLYIFITVLSKGAWATSRGDLTDSMHLSRKLNRSECLRLLESSGNDLTAAEKEKDQHQVSPSTRANCLRRLGRWRDKFPGDHRYDVLLKPMSLLTRGPAWQRSINSSRRKREARLPARFLLRFPAAHSQRNRRHSRRKPRPTAKVKRRKRRKRKSRQLGTNVSNKGRNSLPKPHQVNIIIYDDVPAEKPNGNKNEKPVKQSEANRANGAVVIVLISLASITAAVLLIFCLYKRAQKRPIFEQWFSCPPDIGGSPRDDQSQFDGCTCYSSYDDRNLTEEYSGTSGRQTRSSRSKLKQPTAAETRKKFTKPKTKKGSNKKVSMTKNQCDVKQMSLNEAELRTLQSKIACILRHECGNCACCKCNAANDVEKPKSKFKFFRKKKRGLCNDLRCDENKIRCIVDACGGATELDNFKTTNASRGKLGKKSTWNVKGKGGLRIKE